MKHILCWSGGKDSTASIILAHIHGFPLDTIVFSEVMFDRIRGISGEDPLHINFILKVAKPLFESWGYEVKILHADTDYLDFFYHLIENPRIHHEHKGLHYGFPESGACGFKRDCKEKPIRQYLSSLEDDYIEYVGIGIDEPLRLRSLHKSSSKVSILEECGYTTEMARELCIAYGLYSPSYQNSRRGGCWMCPNAKYTEHEHIATLYPDAWKQFKNLESVPCVANTKWSIYSKDTLMERDVKIGGNKNE